MSSKVRLLQRETSRHVTLWHLEFQHTWLSTLFQLAWNFLNQCDQISLQHWQATSAPAAGLPQLLSTLIIVPSQYTTQPPAAAVTLCDLHPQTSSPSPSQRRRHTEAHKKTLVGTYRAVQKDSHKPAETEETSRQKRWMYWGWVG